MLAQSGRRSLSFLWLELFAVMVNILLLCCSYSLSGVQADGVEPTMQVHMWRSCSFYIHYSRGSVDVTQVSILLYTMISIILDWYAFSIAAD